jgi:hypothetical protein
MWHRGCETRIDNAAIAAVPFLAASDAGADRGKQSSFQHGVHRVLTEFH